MADLGKHEKAPRTPNVHSEGFSPIAESSRDRWQIIGERPLARRGQGAVWRVSDRDSNDRRVFALKEMRYEKGPGTVAYRRFVREISSMSVLGRTHPNIVPVIAHGIPHEDDTWRPYYVMPLAESSLERARDLKGEIERVLKIGIQIADALHAAHGAGIIHRDVKPANVLLFGDEREPRLADFGICHLLNDERLTGLDAQTVGSHRYVAPELLGGGTRDTVSPRADIYSLGKTLYAVLAGSDPFPREDHLDAEWNLATSTGDTRFHHLHALLSRMVATDPSARFQDMRECRDALAAAVDHLRAGRAYVAGMYGGERVPVERFERASRALDDEVGIAQNDVKLRLMEETERIIEEQIAHTTPEGQDVAYFAGILPGDDHLAATCARHLSIGGVAAVARGDDALFEEWVAGIRHATRTSGGMRRSAYIWRAAATGALYSGAILAWRRRRWAMLRELLMLYIEFDRAFVYLKIADGHSSKTADWVETLIKESDVLAAVDPEIATDVSSLIGIITGMAILCDLTTYPDTRIADLLSPDVKIDVPDYPALSARFGDWLSAIPDAAVRSPQVAKGIAILLGLEKPDQARAQLLRIAPLLRRVLASGWRRNISWQAELSEATPWMTWLSHRK